MNKRFLNISILLFVFQISFGQVTFVIDELPEDHDFEESIFISGDFENWSGGSDDFKLYQEGEKYSITLPEDYCKLLFKFTLGSWSTVEVNSEGGAIDNRAYDCQKDGKIISISIASWTVPGAEARVESTASENVSILSDSFEMPQLDRKRTVRVYLPTDYEESSESYPVIYMHDGQNLFDEATAYAGEWNVDEIMNRISGNTGFKAIIVGIDNGGEKRINEYLPWPNSRFPQAEGKEYTQFLVETLKPFIDNNFRTRRDAKNTGLIGSSLGGLITHYAVLNYPEVFGRAGVFSPSFWIADKAYDLAKEKSVQNEARMFFLMGDKESETGVKDMDNMIETMKESGFPSDNIERKVVKGGRHNEKLWRDALEESILWLFDIEMPVLGNSERVFESLNETDEGLEINVSDGTYRIKYYTPEIVETTFIPDGQEFDNESHAVVMKSESPVTRIIEKTDEFIVSTGRLDLLINKNPFQIAYLNGGEIILSEKKGYHKTDYGEAIQLNISQSEALFGGGQRALGMNRRGNRLQLYNRAHYGYEYRSPLMNYSMPIVLSSKIYLVHFDNAPIGYLDLDSKMDNTITYETISGRKTYQVVTGNSWYELLDNYTDLTGKQPLPPLWAFGNFSSRFGYHSEAETRETIQKFKQEGIPVDAVILDVFWFGKDIQGHMGNLEFHRDSFPTPLKMIKDFRDMGVKTIPITEPFILTTSKRWDEAVKANALAKDSTGNPFTYDFYFGNTGLVDVFSEDGQSWFWQKYKDIAEMGAAGVWGDLGEPEVHPSDLLHVNGTADEVHNIYGHQWAKMVYEGYRRDFPNQRPFILMRSGYSGTQRYGMIPWSGDVNRSWGGLHPQNEMALQMAMQGLSYFHSDLGGFAGNYEDDELYLRWLQYGVFQPIFRPHAQEVVASEPVFKAEETKQMAKKVIELRYRLLPYIYTLAFQNNQSGAPMMRPLFFEEPDNIDLYDDASSYLWGDAFLVSPLVEKGLESQTVYFPEGSNWFDYYSGEKFAGGASREVETIVHGIPTFVRGGSFVPTAEVVSSTDYYDPNNLIVNYYFDEQEKNSSASVYIDDGRTPMAYEKGEYEILYFSSTTEESKLTFEVKSETGKNYKENKKELRLMVRNIGQEPSSVSLNGTEVGFRFDPTNRTINLTFNWDSGESFNIDINFK